MTRVQCGKCMLELSAGVGAEWRTRMRSQKRYWAESWERWLTQPQAFQAEGHEARESSEHWEHWEQFIIAGTKRRRPWGELITWKSRLRQSLTGLLCWAKRLELFQEAKGNQLTNREVAWLHLQFRKIGSILEDLLNRREEDRVQKTG